MTYESVAWEQQFIFTVEDGVRITSMTAGPAELFQSIRNPA